MIATATVLMTFRSPAVGRRALGAYLGFAVGDALGATVEFMTAGEISATHGVHREIVGGGWLRLKRGQVTDDTELCLALGNTMLACDGWDLREVADAFVRWMRHGPIDIGHTCRRGFRRCALEGSLSAQPAPDSAGNGAAMRNLPRALATLGDREAFAERSLAQAHISHHHPLSDAATLALGQLTQRFVLGGSLAEVRAHVDQFVVQQPDFRFEPWPGHTSGYIVDTVQTVFDAFFSTTSFEACVVRAVNRGGDADTAGALAGQLAGSHYGVEAIPARWLKRLDAVVQATIREQTVGLLALAERRR